MAGGSLESILKSTHEIKGGVGEERVKKGLRGLSSLSPPLHLLKMFAVSTRCWGLACVSCTLSLAFTAGNTLLILITCVQCLFH